MISTLKRERTLRAVGTHGCASHDAGDLAATNLRSSVDRPPAHSAASTLRVSGSPQALASACAIFSARNNSHIPRGMGAA